MRLGWKGLAGKYVVMLFSFVYTALKDLPGIDLTEHLMKIFTPFDLIKMANNFSQYSNGLAY
jgi:hypothetical protein